MSHHDSSTGSATDACAGACPLAAAGVRYTVDGPLDGPLDGAVDRRTFVSHSLLAAAAMALAACGGGGSDLTAPSSIGSSITVASYPALATTGGVAIVSLSGTRLAIVRTDASTFLALSLVCPHEGGSINQNGTGFLCSKHGARFSSTGTWLGGQRTTNMRSYATTYDASTGTLTIG